MNHKNTASASLPRLIWLILRLHHHRTEVRGTHQCPFRSRHSSLTQGQALKLPEPFSESPWRQIFWLELCGKRKVSTKASKQQTEQQGKAAAFRIIWLGNDAIQKETSWLLSYVSCFSITKTIATILEHPLNDIPVTTDCRGSVVMSMGWSFAVIHLSWHWSLRSLKGSFHKGLGKVLWGFSEVRLGKVIKI